MSTPNDHPLVARFGLAGRRAIVTGGAGYIGKAIALQFLEAGASVVIIDRDPNHIGNVVDELTQATGCPRESVHGLACDLLSESETRDVINQANELNGGVDVLVHSAAFVGTSSLEGWTVPLGEQNTEAWRAALELNLTVPFYVTQQLLQPLTDSGVGSVIMIGSIYGLSGPDQRLYRGLDMGTNPAGYNASKGGLVQLTRYLATTMAPLVRVNCVSPGGILRGQPDQFIQRYSDRTPLARMGKEEEVASAVSFLASDAASYITGQNLSVDGGWTTW